MAELRLAIALFLLLTVLVGLVRVARGPTFADRMLVAQLFGTTGVAVLLILAAAPGSAPLRDVALVFSLLATISVVAFVRLDALRARDGDDEGDDDGDGDGDDESDGR
jgi:multicomponent Na+:H+ antiporter subunit F